MSTEKYYPNWPNTDPVYEIGTEGLEHSSTGILGDIADVFRTLYPMVPIISALATGLLDGDGYSAVPTYGLWAGPGWGGGN